MVRKAEFGFLGAAEGSKSKACEISPHRKEDTYQHILAYVSKWTRLIHGTKGAKPQLHLYLQKAAPSLPPALA